MSCSINEQEIRMLDPRKFHYTYVLKAGTKRFRVSLRDQKNRKQLPRLDFGLRLNFLKCHGKCLEEHF